MSRYRLARFVYKPLVFSVFVLGFLVLISPFGGKRSVAHFVGGIRGMPIIQRLFGVEHMLAGQRDDRFSYTHGQEQLLAQESQDYLPPEVKDDPTLEAFEGVPIEKALTNKVDPNIGTVADHVKIDWTEEATDEIAIPVERDKGVEGRVVEEEKFRICTRGELYTYAYLTIPKWPGNQSYITLEEKDVRIWAPIPLTSSFALTPVLLMDDAKQLFLATPAIEGWIDIYDKMSKLPPDQSRYNLLREALVLYLTQVMMLADSFDVPGADELRGVEQPQFGSHPGEMGGGGIGVMSARLFDSLSPGEFGFSVEQCLKNTKGGEKMTADHYRCVAEKIVEAIEQLAQEDPENPQLTISQDKILMAKTCSELLHQSPRDFGLRLTRVGGTWSVSGDFARGKFIKKGGEIVKDFLEPPPNGGRSMYLDVRNAGYMLLNNVVACTELLMGNTLATRNPGEGDLFTIDQDSGVASADHSEGLSQFQTDMFFKTLLFAKAMKVKKPNPIGWAAAVGLDAWASLIDAFTAKDIVQRLRVLGRKKLAGILTSQYMRGGLYRRGAPGQNNSGTPEWMQPGMAIAVPVKCVCGGSLKQYGDAIAKILLGILGGALEDYGVGWRCTLEAGFIAMSNSSIPGASTNPAVDINNLGLRAMINMGEPGGVLSEPAESLGCTMGKLPACEGVADDKEESNAGVSLEEIQEWKNTYQDGLPLVLFQDVEFDLCSPKFKRGAALPYGVKPRFWRDGCRKKEVTVPVYSFDSSMSLYSLAHKLSRSPDGFGFDPGDSIQLSDVRLMMYALYNNVNIGELSFGLNEGFISMKFNSTLQKMIKRYYDYLKDEAWNFAYMCEISGGVCDFPVDNIVKSMDRLGELFKPGLGAKEVLKHNVTRPFPTKDAERTGE